MCKKYFSNISSNINKEFLAESIEIMDDDVTASKRVAYESSNSLEDLQEFIDALCFQQRYRDAMPYLFNYIIRDKDSYYAHRKLALAYFKTLDFTNALKEFTYCYGNKDDKLDIIYREALCLYNLKQYDNARELFINCYALSKNLPEMYIASIYWHILCLLKLNKSLDEIKPYIIDLSISHHLGYNYFYKVVFNLISENNVNVDSLDTISKICYLYGMSVYYKSDKIMHKKYLDAALSNSTFFGAFAYISAFIE